MAQKTGSKKAGRSKDKCKKYSSFHRREMNKVRRVLRSSGRAAAEKYAHEKGISGYLISWINSRSERTYSG